MEDKDKKGKTKGLRPTSATTTTTATRTSARNDNNDAQDGNASHVPEDSTRAAMASSNRRRALGKGGGNGGTRVGRDSIPSAPSTAPAPSPKRASQQTAGGSSSTSAFLKSKGLDSTAQSISSAAKKVEPTSEEGWLSLDLDEIDIDAQFLVSTTAGGGGGGDNDRSIAAPPDSPTHPGSATQLTLQEVHGVPGAFMSTTSGHYVHREAEAIRQLMGEGSGELDGRGSFLTQPPPRPPADDPPSSPEVSPSPAVLPLPGSSPTVVRGSVNEILIEARPVSRSRSFNSEDEYYSYGSGDLASDDRPVTADVQRRSTRRGNNNSSRASRLMSLRLQLSEMGMYGGGTDGDDPPILVDARPIPKRSRAQVLMLVGLGSLAVVAALAVGLSLGLTQPTSSSGTANDAPPTPAPSPAPTSSLAGQFRSTLPASTQSSLENVTSPQSLAFQYVLTHSVTSASTNGSDTISLLERMTQQFALLTLFYSTSGDGWLSPWINTTASSTAGGFMSDECQWTGITCDVNRTAVRLLLETSFLTGTVPPEIALLSHLADLSLASNPQLRGTLPSEVGQLALLASMSLDAARLSGRLPTELGMLTLLASLKLNGNEALAGPLPTELGRLTRLTDLSLAGNNFTSSIPTEIGLLTLLNRFDVNGNEFTSTIPTEVGRLTSANAFRVHTNKLTGQIPTEIGGLAKLTDIYTYNNAFVGTIPTELGNLVGLKSLMIDTSQLVGAIPTELGRLTNLVEMLMYNNQLNGTIPTELGNMAKLQDFNASGRNNSLSGTIPPQLGNLTSLTKLDLSYSALTGTIPSELARISSLELLYLYYNQLTGSIPTELGALTNLKELALIGNSLNGTVSNTSDLCRRVSSGQLTLAVECTDVPCGCGCQCGRW